MLLKVCNFHFDVYSIFFKLMGFSIDKALSFTSYIIELYFQERPYFENVYFFGKSRIY